MTKERHVCNTGVTKNMTEHLHPDSENDEDDDEDDLYIDWNLEEL